MLRFAMVPALLGALLPVIGQAQSPSPSVVWTQGGPYRLKASVYQSATVSSHPTLVVVLHGDAPFTKPDYQDTFASRIAAGASDIVAVGLLRPGYTDPAGHTSDGERGEATGDNYNAANVDAIAAAIAQLQQQYAARRVVLMGHSGGAAISANLLGRHPALAEAALLVSCPCDVTAWREHMFRKTGVAVFQGPIETLSPVDQVGSIADQTVIRMIVGGDDDVAPPTLSEGYRAAALSRGKRVQLTILPGQGHDILLVPEVQAAAIELLRREAAVPRSGADSSPGLTNRSEAPHAYRTLPAGRVLLL
jgi:pimeloyl-ACP methyl ester carboxylesterase